MRMPTATEAPSMMLDHGRGVEASRLDEEFEQTSSAGALQKGKELGNQDGNHSKKLEAKNLRAHGRSMTWRTETKGCRPVWQRRVFCLDWIP